jgi:hypothetical protein
VWWDVNCEKVRGKNRNNKRYIIWLGISLRDYVGKYRDMNYFLEDLVRN